MTEKEAEARIAELKMDYVRIQNDMEKMESVGHRSSQMEGQLIEIEEELKAIRKQRKKAK